MNYLDIAARGRNEAWRYVAALALAGVVAVIALGLLVAAAQIARVLPANWADAAQDPGRPISFFLFNGLVFGLLVGGLALAVRCVHGKRPRDLLGSWSWRLYAGGAGVWLIMLGLGALVDFVIAPTGFALSADERTPALAFAALGGLAVQTFAEEFIFRGYVTQGLLLAVRRPLPAALLSGMIFGLVHIPNGLPQATSATVFGVLLAVIAIRTRGIAFTCGLHLANNLFGALIVVSSGDVFRSAPGIFSQNTPHLVWWDMALGSLLLAAVTLGVSRPGQPSSAQTRPG